MSRRISYSQVRMFSECGMKWKYAYIDGFREKVRSGALFLGSAIDEALNVLLKTKDLDNAVIAFRQAFSAGTINDLAIDIKTSPRVVYGERDMDWDLITVEDMEDIAQYCSDEHKDNLKGLFNSIRALKKANGWKNLHESTQTFYNVCNWHSLWHKGVLMLEAYNNEIIPRIKVIEVQKEIKLNNGTDELVGYLDLLCTWENGEVILFDNKTAGQPYEDDAVRTSQQLTIYSEALAQEGIKVDKRGYIVMLKNIDKDYIRHCVSCGNVAEKAARHKTCNNEINGKRCGGDWHEVMNPKCHIQVLIDDIPTRTKDIILENIDQTNQLMQSGTVTRNFQSCNASYGRCQFYDLCYKDDASELDQKKK